MNLPGAPPNFDPDEGLRAWSRPGDLRFRFTLDITRETAGALSVVHDLTDDDLRRMPDCNFFHDPRPLFGLIPQWALILGLMFGVGFLIGVSRSLTLALIFGTILAVLTAVVYAIAGADNRWAARQHGYCKNRTVTIAPAGFCVRIPDVEITRLHYVGELEYSWGAVRKVEATGDDLVFWLERPGRARVIVPRRAFATPVEADAFFRAASEWHAAAHREPSYWTIP